MLPLIFFCRFKWIILMSSSLFQEVLLDRLFVLITVRAGGFLLLISTSKIRSIRIFVLFLHILFLIYISRSTLHSTGNFLACPLFFDHLNRITFLLIQQNLSSFGLMRLLSHLIREFMNINLRFLSLANWCLILTLQLLL